MKIWKYELKITDNQKIKVGDKKAKPLSVAEQNGKLVMWVQLDEDYEAEGTHEIEVQVIGTGERYDYTGDFVGTAAMSNDEVWHVYVT